MSEHGSFSNEPSYLDDDDSSGRGVVRIASVAALGGFLFGYDSAVINGAVSAIETRFEVGSASLGFAVASALLGAAAGAIYAGRLADRADARALDHRAVGRGHPERGGRVPDAVDVDAGVGADHVRRVGPGRTRAHRDR